MGLDNASIDRLKAQLLTSGLQEKNQALFQIINQLIDSQRTIITTINKANAASDALATPTYNIANVAVTRTYDTAVPILADLGNLVGTLIADLKARGLLK